MAEPLTPQTAERLANLALACVHREYPNKLSHVLNSDADVKPPRELTPAFYGCFDWHSSVHGHWLLARLARTFPDAPLAVKAKSALAMSLTAPNLKSETEYASGDGRESFERPYGLAWLMQLAAELHEWNAPEATQWAANLKPLEEVAVIRISNWLRKLTNPVRSGEHSNTAFALGLMLDYARSMNRADFARKLEGSIRRFYLADQACPLSYEPSGEDFLSPCLAEADAVRRIIQGREYADWLSRFLPGSIDGMHPAIVLDPSDGRLAHLDGLNLSRAWMLQGIASALPAGDARIETFRTAAQQHAGAGLKSVTGEHYAGGHWLGSFAVYLLTQRGLR